jgi:hypothetical protein
MAQAPINDVAEHLGRQSADGSAQGFQLGRSLCIKMDQEADGIALRAMPSG